LAIPSSLSHALLINMAAASVQAPLINSRPYPGAEMSHLDGNKQAPDCNVQQPSSVEDILQKSGQDGLGASSKTLSVNDFELVKTLGTGTSVSNEISIGWRVYRDRIAETH
jgi:hypothetical protein